MAGEDRVSALLALFSQRLGLDTDGRQRAEALFDEWLGALRQGSETETIVQVSGCIAQVRTRAKCGQPRS
jgi:hypothetical protein